jgi:hypothetical protein
MTGASKASGLPAVFFGMAMRGADDANSLAFGYRGTHYRLCAIGRPPVRPAALASDMDDPVHHTHVMQPPCTAESAK